MRTIRPNTRRRPLWRTVLLVLLAVVIGGAGTVAALAYFNVIDAAKLAFWRSKEADHTGLVPVPICARTIPAYATVTRDDLMDPKTHRWVLDWRRPEEVPKGVITDVSKIRGRVTAREKTAPYFFYESDFLPKGTHPGVAGGTPEGKRAITLDASKLKGASDLKEGDHVDLLASIPVDMPGAGRAGAGRSGMNVVTTPNVALLPKRSFIRPLVEDGVVVMPQRTRNVPITSSSLTQGTVTRTRPVQEIVIAVDPEEVGLLAEAMDLKYEITCVARSGRPAKHTLPAAQSATDDPPDLLTALKRAFLNTSGSAEPGKAKPAAAKTRTAGRAGRGGVGKDPAALDMTPGLDPFANIQYLEIMIGAQRQFMLFNGPGNSPVVAFQDGELTKSRSDVEESRQ